ncbi:Folylpolyglutamate synthetase [Elasticomyces elasticus]|nr:Folylpolyglutamate synthetase [Elasticomyces elasticus]
MSKPYVYRKLDPKRLEIRLLKVLPDEAEKPVRVIVRMVQLPAVYETISYAWGDPARSCEIVVRLNKRRRWSRQLRVPVNTQAALRRMRYSDRACTIWIDAVCINQDDKVERSQQVAIMGKIFASSFGNLVYLGELEDADMAAHIQSTIDNLLLHAKYETNNFRTFDSTVFDEAYRSQLERQGLPFEVDKDLVGLVLRLPWFRRLWVLQEAVMAPNSTAFLGSLQLDLHDMLHAFIWWERHLTSYPSGTTQGVQCLITTYFALFQPGGSRAASTQPLANLLITANDFQKSEPRDGVYALISMMDERSSSALSPDYTKPLSEVLQSASRLAIEQDPFILTEIAHRPGDLERAEVASWAMRVDREMDWDIDPKPIERPDSGLYTISKRPDNTSGGWKPRVLNLQGHRADIVSIVTPLCARSIHGDAGAFLVWLWGAVELYTSVSGPSSREAKATTFAKTLCADDYWRRQYHELEDEKRNPIERLLAALGAAETEDILEHFEASYAFTPGFWNSILNRRCFVTQQGRLGLGPLDTQPGDVVAMLSGTSNPFILRPLDGGQYQLVGASYVDGIMPEQLDDEWESKEPEVFALV